MKICWDNLENLRYNSNTGRWYKNIGYRKSSNTKSLHCHHIEGIKWEPLESADIDKCITLCKDCHKKVYKKEGYKYYEMKCKEVLAHL